MIYRVTVRGRLAPRLLALLGDAVAEHESEHECGDADDRSAYRAEVVDQADLYGLLEVLQRAGVELLSVVEAPRGD